MLAYILAIAVGLGSFVIYMAAFFFPEVHRKSDFFWSGVGLFYALILWACAGRITGAVLLGQMASVGLLGWLGWQTLTLRRAVTPVSQQTPVPAKVQASVEQVLGQPQNQPLAEMVTSTPTEPQTVESVSSPEDIAPVSPAVEPQAITATPLEEVTTKTEPAEPQTVESVSSPEDVAPVSPAVEPQEVVVTPPEEVLTATEPVETVALTEEVTTESIPDVEVEAVEAETSPQTESSVPQPKRSSRLFRAFAGLFNRRKPQASQTPTEEVSTEVSPPTEDIEATPSAEDVTDNLEEVSTEATPLAEDVTTDNLEEVSTEATPPTEDVTTDNLEEVSTEVSPPTEDIITDNLEEVSTEVSPPTEDITTDNLEEVSTEETQTEDVGETLEASVMEAAVMEETEEPVTLTLSEVEELSPTPVESMTSSAFLEEPETSTEETEKPPEETDLLRKTDTTR